MECELCCVKTGLCITKAWYKVLALFDCICCISRPVLIPTVEDENELCPGFKEYLLLPTNSHMYRTFKNESNLSYENIMQQLGNPQEISTKEGTFKPVNIEGDFAILFDKNIPKQ